MTITGEFRQRAFHEARRYGGDSWVFVRELLQNSRDAGATRVDLIVERCGGVDRIICRDNGCGMSFDHARRYLFTLYASSKTEGGDAAGRFGIGFWAVLRFEPDEVVVRSAPAGEAGWQLTMSGDLEEIRRTESSLVEGTEIELNRKARGNDPVAAVWDAVQRDARHLRGEDGEILEVRVNSRPATAEIELDPPSLSFSRPGLQGAVALSDQPQVDLLAHGLRVRTTATLDELLTRPDRRRRRKSSTPEGLVPRVILDSRRLQVLMARGNARTDRELRQLVAIGGRGVRRLVQNQLDRGAGLGWMRRAGMRCFEVASTRWARRVAVGLIGLMSVVACFWWFKAGGSGRPEPLDQRGTERSALVRHHRESILQSDAVDRYRGPAVDALETLPTTIPLRYSPSDAEPRFVVFRVTALADDGRVAPPPTNPATRRYLGASCGSSCLDVTLDLQGASGSLRLPVPTGHLLDPASLRIDGGSAVLRAAPDGGPMLIVDDTFSGRVRYRTGEGFEIQPVVGGSWPALAEPADAIAVDLRSLPIDEAARVAGDWVRRHVVYDTSEQTVRQHREAADDGIPFTARCIAVGAGDCDVQNAFLAAMLARSEITVRLAVGFVGARGRCLPGLHAWVEYRGETGSWRAVDASQGGSIDTTVHQPLAVDGPSAMESGGESPARSGLQRISPSTESQRAWAGLAFVLVSVAGIVWFARRRWTIGRVRRNENVDLAGLLRGALARPEAYREVPALFARRVVPVVGSSAMSLDRARSLSHRGRLAVSSHSSEFARRVAAGGLPVIDGSRPEGGAVAATLGAVDLDRWDGILRRSREHPVTVDLERAAAKVGENWRVVVAAGLADEVIILGGGLAGRRQIVVVDRERELWRCVEELAGDRRSAAVFLLGERVVERLQGSPIRKRRLLSALAMGAVLERSGERR